MTPSTHPATTGGSYYPEMGGTHDGTALFEMHGGPRVRPAHMEPFTAHPSGRARWSCSLTRAAGDKIRPAHGVVELLLD